MRLIALLSLCLAAVSCDKKGVRSVDVPTGDVAVEEVLTEDVLANAGLVCTGSLQLPAGTGMLAEDLQVISFYDEATPNAAGAFAISMAENKKPQFVWAIDPETDNSLLLGYVNPLESEQVNLSCESTAVGLAFLSPLMIGTTAEQRSEFISEIKAHPNFSLLVETVEATLQADPQYALDGTTHPELYEQAAEIAVDVWQGMAAAGKLLAPAEAQGTVCDENREANVWLTDGPGNDIVFCNPKMVYYVSSIEGVEGTTFLEQLVTIKPKQKAFQFSFNVGVDPVPTGYGLPAGAGTFNYEVTRGWSPRYEEISKIGSKEFWDWGTPYGRASQLNLAQFVIHGLDLAGLGGFEIPDGPISFDVAEVNEDRGNIVLTFIGISAFVLKNFDKIIKWIGGNPTKVFKASALKVITQNAAIVGHVIKGIKATNKMVPFLADITTAWERSSNPGKFTQADDGSIEILIKHSDWDTYEKEFAKTIQEFSEFAHELANRQVDIPGGGKMAFVNVGDLVGGTWVSKYEVTQGQWLDVMGGSPWEKPWKQGNVEDDWSAPATHIESWQAEEFVARLNEWEGHLWYRLLGKRELDLCERERSEGLGLDGDENFCAETTGVRLLRYTSPRRSWEWEYRVADLGAGAQMKFVLIDDDFYMGQYEVTQGQWQAVMGTTPWSGQADVMEGPDYPAVYVSREDVLEFIERLNEEGRFYRLPTAEEWGKAVGSYPGSMNDYGVSENDDVPHAQTGGSKIANFWRLYDMSGNVQEWVYDLPGSDYVVRGGSFNGPSEDFYSENRNDSDHADAYTGFRLVRGSDEEWYAPLPPPPFVVLNEERTFSLPGGAQMAFMRIDPGAFLMGDEEAGLVHEVGISRGFWLGKYEVTQGQWQAVMRTTPWSGQGNVRAGSSYPAVYVSWEDAQAFIVRLNAAAGDSLYRLPSEAEWEYACRAGTDTQWSFGDDESDLTYYAWYRGNTEGLRDGGLKVGRRLSNPWGLHDMHGNVAEWVQDVFSGYPNRVARLDPLGSLGVGTHAFRGGSFDQDAFGVRSAFRTYAGSGGTTSYIGLRLVRIITPAAPEGSGTLPVEVLGVSPVEVLAEEDTFELPGTDEQMAFMRIEPGVFLMGDYDVGPVHEVGISRGFWLGKYEVTQGQWQAVMRTTPWSSQGNVRAGSSYPAVYVSWEDAQAFIVRLNTAAGDSLYRLPSEAEWEYACRAGTNTRWVFGDDESDLTYHGWYYDNAGHWNERYGHKVGMLLPNRWGLHDMHGNVAEWVQDVFSGYPNRVARLDPLGSLGVGTHAFRGGSFDQDAFGVRSAFRTYAGSGGTASYIGLRLVRIITPEVPEGSGTLPVEVMGVSPVEVLAEEDTFELPGTDEQMAFMRIEPGMFLMGDYDEGPVHEVGISRGFWLGKYEITQGQWQAVMGETERAAPWSSQGNVREGSSYPAVYVSWEDAQAFIVRLNAAAGDSLYRLPSEAEWEYACRAGTSTQWSFGNDESDLTYHGWYYDNAGLWNERYGHKVGMLLPNRWGLHDMHGNVAEWVQDVFSGYPNRVARLDPLGSLGVGTHAFRGGSFDQDAFGVRSAFRTYAGSGGTTSYIGLRLVRIITPEVPEGSGTLPVEVMGVSPVEVLAEEDTFELPGTDEQMAFMRIEPGAFLMGDYDEGPVHEVGISRGFWLGKYEVTQGQWQAVMGETERAAPWSSQGNVREGSSYPAVYVSWEDAQAFISQLNAAAGDSLYRLPSEAEWEYACRAGTSTQWSFGNDESDLTYHAWYYDNAGLWNERYGHKVGMLLPNRWGLHDMHGNVAEWVQDGIRSYNSVPQLDPLGPLGGGTRAFRGGSFDQDAFGVRSAYRTYAGSGGTTSYIGLRLVRFR